MGCLYVMERYVHVCLSEKDVHTRPYKNEFPFAKCHAIKNVVLTISPRLSTRERKDVFVLNESLHA